MNLVELLVLVLLVGFAAIFIGVLLVMLSVLREAAKSRYEGKAEAGGVLVIGPVPIVFGTSERIAKAMLVLAIVLTLVVLVAYLVFIGVIRWWS